MKAATIIFSLLASPILAQPHKQAHQHRHKHEARKEAVEWVTEWAYETEIVPVTETIWVSEGFVPPTTTASSTTTKVPAQFFQPVSKAKSPSPSPSTTSVSVADPPAPTSTVQPTTVAAPVAPEVKAPEVKTTTSTTSTSAPAPSPEPVVQPSQEPKKAYTAPAPQTSAYSPPAPAAGTSSGSGSGSSSGECSKGSPCEGDITHYDANAGLGACGWLSDGESENVIALPHGLMGTQSNGNPYCGRKVTVTLNGKSIIAKIVDKCMGCVGHSIDLSNHAFKELEDMGVGRTQASWYFSD